MKVILSFIALFFVLDTSAQADSILVKECFNQYKEAVLTDKGEVALSLIDKKTIIYYNEILEKTKTYDSIKLQKESLINKVTILVLRHRASKKEILKMNGESLFIYAINNGLVGKNSVANTSVGNISITGDFAKGVVQVNGRNSPLFYNFYKEEARWKINLTSIHPIGNMAFKKMIEDSGMSENEALLSMIEAASGTKPNNTIWTPLVSNK